MKKMNEMPKKMGLGRLDRDNYNKKGLVTTIFFSNYKVLVTTNNLHTTFTHYI